jgi:hypothetical protein
MKKDLKQNNIGRIGFSINNFANCEEGKLKRSDTRTQSI